MATEGLEAYFLKHLKLKLSPANAFTIAEYISSMKVETKEIDVIIIPNTGYTLKTYIIRISLIISQVFHFYVAKF
jgi:hypothetical protein